MAKYAWEKKNKISDDLRKQMIKEERSKYLKGKGKAFGWDEVKAMALNKEKRIALSKNK